ncbi:MAG: PilZ domain-containing protein [Planctomycetota bacterium]
MPTPSSSLTERRRFVRSRYSRLCRVSIEGESFDWSCADLSLRGMKLQWSENNPRPELEVGQRVSIAVCAPIVGDHPRRSLRLGARVRWIRSGECGVEFTLLSLDGLSFLRAALAFRRGAPDGPELETLRRARDPESPS